MLCWLLLASSAAEKCYALALSGGGDKGAYEAGVIQGLVERLPAEERQWNVVTGISAGSITASGAALFSRGDEEAMAAFLVKTVSAFSKSSVFHDWFPFGVLSGLDKPGLYDTAPLQRTMEEILARGRPANPRNITIGATSDETGNLHTWNESSWTSAEEWATRVRASAGIPGILESVTIDGETFSDGGVVMGVNVFAAVQRCRDVLPPGSNHDIVVDVVTCDSRKHIKPFSQKENTALPLFLRASEIQRVDKFNVAIDDACRAYPDVTWRYLVEPSESLDSDGLEFNHTAMLRMVRIGNMDAKNATVGRACKGRTPPGPVVV